MFIIIIIEDAFRILNYNIDCPKLYLFKNKNLLFLLNLLLLKLENTCKSHVREIL